MEIIFNKIEYKNIFVEDFKEMKKNNKLDFKNGKISVIYAPNGTGKTSLVNALSGESNSNLKFKFENNDKKIEEIFYVINDQNNRNIILGETKDFLLGDNIKREHELLLELKEQREHLIKETIDVLKMYGISTSNSSLFGSILPDEIRGFLKDCANSKSKGKNFSNENIVELITKMKTFDNVEYSDDELRYFQEDWGNSKSIFKQISKFTNEEIEPNERVKLIEENTEAIKVLNRFKNETCIVCDNENINRPKLITDKTKCKEDTMNKLSEKVKSVIVKVIEYVPENDPFNIKINLLQAIETGNVNYIKTLNENCGKYQDLHGKLLYNELEKRVANHSIIDIYNEYKEIVANRAEIRDEDYLYIEEIISNSMGKSLSVERDNNNILRIKLDNKEFIGKDRGELPLSNGEQNFLSLSFEFLKAKNSSCPIVVVDDPISSFDSIYKNKVAYSTIKILSDKCRIILTHNVDLIRLLEGQYKDCFNLYLLNNTDGENNGFIHINRIEKNMLINLDQLLNSFRNDVPKKVVQQNRELFLISMIPFMRGYAQIINNKNVYEELTKVMHGYNTEKIDIGQKYTEIFGNNEQYLLKSYKVSAEDILSVNFEKVNLVDETKYPLLNKTLRHTGEYLFLRLLVEKSLVEKYGIDTMKYKQLGQIISQAFPNDNIEHIKNRIRLTAKKTLMNEFNHFEGNLSIFQPAIDITDRVLEKEKEDIVCFIDSL
ncbi:MAG: hypothetical protein R3Y09_02660 [Clostridia bacterium]